MVGGKFLAGLLLDQCFKAIDQLLEAFDIQLGVLNVVLAGEKVYS